MEPIHFEIHFPKMPLWKGVLNKPGRPEFLPFSLGWDERGYIGQTTPEEVQQKVFKYYGNEDYEFPSTPPGGSAWGDLRGDLAIEFIRDTCGPIAGKRVLDIGGGTTYIGSRLTSEEGVEEYTIMDPSVWEVPPSPRIRIIREYFSSQSCPGDDFDLIISMNCLEHVPDPVDFLKGIRQVIRRKQGKALLIFPDNEKQLLNGDFNAVLHEHINYFTRNIVQNLADLCGFNIITCESRYDLFYCYLEESERIKTGTKQIDKVMIKAADAFVDNLQYFNRLIKHFYESTQRIAFHGACNGLNNILAFADFHDESFLEEIAIFDGDERKFGKYMPMCPHPIMDSRSREYKNFDHVIVSAMTFYDQISELLLSHHGFSPDYIHPLYPLKNDRNR